MKQIKKHCSSLQQAERYQNRLYNKYDSVKLVSFPFCSDEGLYVWSVA